MAKSDIIDEIMATRNPDILIDALWDDPAIKHLVRHKLEAITAANIKHYHKHFVGESKHE